MIKSRANNPLAAAGFLLPNILGFLVFTAGPLVFSLAVSFTNWNVQRTIPFRVSGSENYTELLHDKQFWIFFINTVYLMLGLPFCIAGSLFLAVLLNQRLRGMVAYRTLFYLPSFTSGVALMILWKALYSPDFGPINALLDWCLQALRINDLLQALGFHALSPPQWLASTDNLLGLVPQEIRISGGKFGMGAREALIIMGVWIAIGGNNMLLYLAALTNVPQELVEAAQIDGASRWKVFRHVTWPQLAPTTFFIVVMSFIGSLQGGFDQARVMTNGGPSGTTTTLAYYIYTKAFEEFQIGYASAVAWILFTVIFVITLINWKFGQKELSY